jgi:hypothetical protein
VGIAYRNENKLILSLVSCCAFNLHNLDGQDARPTRNVLNDNELVKARAAYAVPTLHLEAVK